MVKRRLSARLEAVTDFSFLIRSQASYPTMTKAPANDVSRHDQEAVLRLYQAIHFTL